MTCVVSRACWPHREGSEGFIATQYKTIGMITAAMTVVIFFGFMLRKASLHLTYSAHGWRVACV